MTELVQALALGILIGGVYSLASAGLALIYGVMGIVSLAHGAFLILAAFLTYSLWSWLGLDPLLAAVVIAPVMFALGWLTYSVTIRPIREAPIGAGILVTFGIALVLEASMGVIWGNTSHAVRPAYFDQSFEIGGILFPKALVYATALAVVVLAGLYLFLRATWTGRAIRAASASPVGAKLVGVNVGRVATVAFAVGVGVTAAGGSSLSVLYPFVPGSQTEWIVRLLAIVVLGGMGSMAGAALGGVLLGVAESLTAVYIGPTWTTGVPYIIIVAVLLLRPQGLLGSRLRQDVATT